MNNACSSRITAAAGTGLAGTDWQLESLSSLLTEFYNSRLHHSFDYRDQTFVHCPQFPTAADEGAVFQSPCDGPSSQTR